MKLENVSLVQTENEDCMKIVRGQFELLFLMPKERDAFTVLSISSAIYFNEKDLVVSKG